MNAAPCPGQGPAGPTELARAARLATAAELGAAIANDIAQPLMSIAADAGASLRWLDEHPACVEQVRRGLLAIADQSRRAGAILQAMHARTRQAAPFEELDLHTLIVDCVGMLCDDAMLDLAAASGRVHGDAVGLRQALFELLANGLEASAGNGGARLLSIATRSCGNGMLAVQVDDGGAGFGARPAAELFEPLRSTKPGHLGLGLAICRSVVQAHGGQIAALGRQPHGCSIIFTLPELRIEDRPVQENQA